MCYDNDILEAENIEQSVEIALLKVRVKELEEEVEAYKTNIDLLQENSVNQRDHITKLQRWILKSLDNKEPDLNELGEIYMEEEAKEVEDLEDELELLRGTLRWWQRKCLRLEEEVEVCKRSIDGRDMTAGNQADYIAKLQAEINELSEARAEAAEAYIQSKTSLEERIALLTAEKGVSLENHTEIVNELREDLDVMTLHRNNLQKERLEHIKEIEVLKSTSNVNVVIEGLTADLRDKNKKVIELEERNDTLIKERAELAKSQIAKVDELRNRIDELEELNHELIAENLRLEDGLADIGFYRDKKC